MPGTSWSEARKILHGRRVAINGALCLDEARRLTPGETVTLADRALPPPPRDEDVAIRFIDGSLVVVEKPSGMLTLRRLSEQGWTAQRRGLQPTLDEVIPRLIAQHAAHKTGSRVKRSRIPRLYPVHRIDRDTSGLLVIARSDEARQILISQFAEHKAVRTYLAIVPGHPKSQTICTQLIRDRGDGLRGSTSDASIGQQAVTHIKNLRKIGAYSELECRLETGRTNQIRIHLAEMGHPVCGDVKYRGPFGEPPREDASGSPRLALHATRLQLAHPETGETLDYESPWPSDMQRLLERLAAKGET